MIEQYYASNDGSGAPEPVVYLMLKPTPRIPKLLPVPPRSGQQPASEEEFYRYIRVILLATSLEKIEKQDVRRMAHFCGRSEEAIESALAEAFAKL